MPARPWSDCRHPRESGDPCVSRSCEPRIKSGVTKHRQFGTVILRHSLSTSRHKYGYVFPDVVSKANRPAGRGIRG